MNQQDDTTKDDKSKGESYEFYVAGVQHHQLYKCIDEVRQGDHLIMVPEPSNKYDPNAVRLEFSTLNQGEVMTGYVPGKISASVSASIVVADMECVVTEITPHEKPWKQLKVKISEVNNG